jgi:hypothetical protein
MAAVAALGFALSACGGAGSSAAGAPASQSATSSDSSVATGSSAPASGSTTAPGTSTGTASQSPTGSGSSGISNPPTASSGNVTINWDPPTQNTNGSPLTNLAGFKIHYGTASQKYTQTITVSNPGLVTYVIANLSPGKYYFAVTAYSAAGTESPLSSEVSTKVN